jgi:hypothetical protein
MEPTGSPCLAADLTWRVHVRTGWRIRNLAIDVQPECVVLRGRATTGFTRQLLEQAAHDLLPNCALVFDVEVDHEEEILLGVPMS